METADQKFKAAVLQAVVAATDARLAEAAAALQLAEEAAKDDTKSSAGDKYETTREMMQQQIDNNRKLLFEAGKHKTFLQQLPMNTADRVANGSLIETNQGWFFISISAGAVQAAGQTVTALSQAAPLGRALMELQPGQKTVFNGREFSILRLI